MKYYLGYFNKSLDKFCVLCETHSHGIAVHMKNMYKEAYEKVAPEAPYEVKSESELPEDYVWVESN